MTCRAAKDIATAMEVDKRRIITAAWPTNPLCLDTACINCHTIRGEAEGIADGVADGRFGPDLTHLMSRATIGAGAAENTPENLRDWVNDPEHLKPGVLMPPMKLDRRRLDRLVAYLTSLR